MSNNETHFCKFCGEKVQYLRDFNDYFCNYCHSYQTHSEPIDAMGKKIPVNQIDLNPPPLSPPQLPPLWSKNIPMFRHREYFIIQAYFSWGAKYSIYNVSGNLMGEIKGKVVSWGGEFEFFNINNIRVGKVIGNPTILRFQTKTYEIFDHQGSFAGAIKSIYGFLRRNWELYDAQGILIGRSDERIFLKGWHLLDVQGRTIISVDKKPFTFRDQFRVTVSEYINPQIAIAFVVAIDHMHFRRND